MTPWQRTLEVARWEFNRFVKWRQQFVGIAVMLVVALGGGQVGKLIKNAGNKPVTVAVVGAETLDFELPAVGPVVWDAGIPHTEDEARAAVADERIGGVLIVRSPSDAELVVRRRAAWTERVEGALRTARRAAAPSRLRLPPEATAALAAPFAITTVFIDAGAARVTRATRVVAFVILALGLMVLFSGFATLFAGITGEKQQRVTEQMVAMVGPQTWMDGKILGLAATAFVGAAFLVVSGLIAVRVLPAMLGKTPLALPPVAFDLGLLALIALVTALGVMMWFAFLAAIAATIDDPNSSTRTMMLFVPMLPTVAAFALVPKADSVVAQVLAVFPLTSMSMLPVRLVMTTVPWWEPTFAIALLVAAAWFFRRAAGKIFGLGILMYGKEPTLRELARWARQA